MGTFIARRVLRTIPDAILLMISTAMRVDRLQSMELMFIISLSFFGLIAVMWVVLGTLAIRAVLAVKPLPALDSLPALSSRPGVSVIIAVRDEAERIETTVRQVMDQVGVELELIVVDDRSTDDTPPILSRLQAEFAALQVIRVDQLPADWLGKCHAMYVGSKAAKYEWLLFADGDIWLKPEAIVRAVATALAERAEHLTMTPNFHASRPLSMGFQSSMLVFQLLFAVELSRANRDEPNSMNGVGAFNLIRKKAYTEIGGHVTLRMEVADDVKLGLLITRTGHRSRLFLGHELIEADWANTIWGIVKALEKNGFVGLNYSVFRLVGVTTMFAAMWLGALIGPFTRTWAGYSAFAGMGLFVVAAVLQTRRIGWVVLSALLTPIYMPIIMVVFWNSAIKSLRQGGIRWRDTFYPLPLLRQHLIKTEKSGPFSV